MAREKQRDHGSQIAALFAQVVSTVATPEPSADPVEIIADRCKRMMLEEAERAMRQLDSSSTIQDRTAAIGATNVALKANGFDGAPKAQPGDQPTFLVEFGFSSEDDLEIRAESQTSERQADAVSGVADAEEATESRRSRGAA